MATKKKNGRAARVAAAAVNGSNGGPEGFRKVETVLTGFWKPAEEGDFVQGVVGEAVEVQGADGKTNIFYSMTLTTNEATPIKTKAGKLIAVGEGQMIGVGGKMLLIFLRGREGKEVYVSYAGLGEAKAGKQAAKLFNTYERDDE